MLAAYFRQCAETTALSFVHTGRERFQDHCDTIISHWGVLKHLTDTEILVRSCHLLDPVVSTTDCHFPKLFEVDIRIVTVSAFPTTAGWFPVVLVLILVIVLAAPLMQYASVTRRTHLHYIFYIRYLGNHSYFWLRQG
jgi:hypothetical protein